MMSPIVPSMFFIQIHASSKSKKKGGEPPLLGSKFWHNTTKLSNTKIKRLTKHLVSETLHRKADKVTLKMIKPKLHALNEI